jgi:hypothetical protein
MSLCVNGSTKYTFADYFVPTEDITRQHLFRIFLQCEFYFVHLILRPHGKGKLSLKIVIREKCFFFNWS